MFRAICRSIKKRKSILNFTNEELVGCSGAIANDAQVTKAVTHFKLKCLAITVLHVIAMSFM